MRKRKKKIPFWLQVLLILSVGIMATVVVLLVANHTRSDNKSNETVDSESIKQDKAFTVTFAYQDGTAIEKKEVKYGHGIYPPKIETDCVFRGWSSAINNVTSNIEVHPMLYTIVEDNLFYFDTVYVKEGEDFTLELYVAGNVNVSNCELELEFDQEVMAYSSSETIKDCNISKSKDGMLSVKIHSAAPITEKTKLADITFNAKEEDVYSSQINLKSKGASVKINENDTPIDSATINNNIYFLQEVD